jgi:hypothetical protein
MIPSKHHQLGGPQIIQFCGLLILIEMIYKCFGAGVSPRITPLAIFAFAIGTFLFVWPMSLKEKR